MARQRKMVSARVSDAEARLANLKSIDPALNMGTGLTIAAFQTAISDSRTAVDVYNQTLALADSQANDIVQKDKIVQDISVRMLAAVGAKYGYDSDEYEQAGGTRKSERAKPVRSAKPKL